MDQERRNSIRGTERARAWIGRAGRWFNRLADRHRVPGVIRVLATDFRELGLSLRSIHFAFHGFIAVFPLVMIVIAAMGLLLEAAPGFRDGMLEAVYEMFPDFDAAFVGMLEFIEARRPWALIIGIVIFLWSGIKAAEAIEDAFSSIWGTGTRTPGRRKAVALAILASFGILTVINGLLNFTAPITLSHVYSRSGGAALAGALLANAALGFSLGFIIYVILFSLVPIRRPRSAVIAGVAALTSLASLLMDYLFGFYFELMTETRFLYGSIGFFLGILVWLYFVAALTFLGGILVRHLSEKRCSRTADPGESRGFP